MVTSAAKTVPAYLATLPLERRKSVAAVRKMVKAHMPKGYKEVMHWGMICWEIPLARYPDTYNGQPLCYAGLAAQKHHISLHLTGVYMFPEQVAAIQAAFRAAGQRLDMGKSCIRFKAADEIPLAALGKLIAGVPPAKYIVRYEQLTKK
ncbi:MAG: DUF1801 domain-containing protein [Gemmatimonadota bacterium]